MLYKFFTQDVYMESPTYFESLNLKDKDNWPMVNMTADVLFSSEFNKEDNPCLDITIQNRMWADPIKDDLGIDQYFSLSVSLNMNQALYLKKYIEAFLEIQQSGSE